MAISIWWVRRDLRLADNQALSAACAEGGQVIPLFILDPRLLGSQYAGEKRQAFLIDGLRSLDVDLRRIGSLQAIVAGRPTGRGR